MFLIIWFVIILSIKENNLVNEYYLDFVITPEFAQTYPGATAGTYSLRGGLDEDSSVKPIHDQNIITLNNAFGDDICPLSLSNLYYECKIDDVVYSYTTVYGIVYMYNEKDDDISSCGIDYTTTGASCSYNN